MNDGSNVKGKAVEENIFICMWVNVTMDKGIRRTQIILLVVKEKVFTDGGWSHGRESTCASVSCSPVRVEDDGPAVDDEVGELPGDAEGALPLPLALLAVRRGLRRLTDPVHPLQRLVPRLPRHLVSDGRVRKEWHIVSFCSRRESSA